MKESLIDSRFIIDLMKKEIESNKDFSNELIKTNKEKGLSIGRDNGYSALITSLKLRFGLSDYKIISESIIIDGDKDGSIDAVFIDKEEKVIYFVDSKDGKGGFKRVDIINKLLMEGIEKNFLDCTKDLSGLNKLAEEKIGKARDFYHKFKDYKLKIVIARILFQGYIEDKLEKNIKNKISEFGDNNIEIEFLNLTDFANLLIDKKNKKYECRFNFNKDDSFKYGSDEIDKIVVGKLKIKELVEIVIDAKDKDYDIFDENIRENISDSKFKESLKRVIEKNKNKFFLYHNGITISCEKIISKGTTIHVVNPHIINGCQSVMALKDIFEEDNNIIDEDVYILCRFFEAKIEEINAVCQTTNTQRKIESWDLRSNDDEQKFIEKAIGFMNINYNRKKKKRSPKDGRDIILTDVAQWIHSCKNEEPAAAKSSKSELFNIIPKNKKHKENNLKEKNNTTYKEIFDIDNLEFDILKNILDTGIFVKNEIKKRIGENKNNPKSEDKTFLENADFHIMAHMYAYGGGIDIEKFDEAVLICKEAYKKMQEVKGENYSPNSAFKNKNTWLEIKKINAGNKE